MLKILIAQKSAQGFYETWQGIGTDYSANEIQEQASTDGGINSAVRLYLVFANQNF